MKKKQIIFIMTDTTRKDMLGCYGNKNMITPNLDKLAEEGIKYENAYCSQPVCGPARSAIFTGLSPHTNGVVSNNLALGDNVKTIGQRLSDNNILCGYIGKWHLDGSDYFGNGKCPNGWDKKYWYDMRTYLEELNEEERINSRNPEFSYDENFSETITYGYRCTQKALEFIKENYDKDFFLVISYDEPHGPSLCPSPYSTMYSDFKFPNNPNFTDSLENKPLMQKLWAGENINLTENELNKPSKGLALFLGCNSYVDNLIGNVLTQIKELTPDSLIIYTSDHGDMLGSHKLQMKNATAYKEVANIPLIIKGGEINKTITSPASHLDIVPTVLDYMKIPLPKWLDGKSLLPQIYDCKNKINDTVFVQFTRYEVDHDGFGGLQIMRAAVSEKYKLVINLLDTDEFYDLEKDPYEINNLINNTKYTHERNNLHDILLNEMNTTRDLYRGYQWAVRPWRKDYKPTWTNDGYTRQRENEEYEPRQLDYDTGIEMLTAIRKKTTMDEKK